MPKPLTPMTAAFASVIFASLLAGFPLFAQANEGGGKAVCPWAKDLHIDVGGHPLVLPQTIFEGKAQQVAIDGYEVLPNVGQLKVTIIGPYADMWEAALTFIDGGKRCMTYYVGEPVLVSEPQSSPSPTKH